MKKIIICLFVAIALSNCEVKIQSTQAQSLHLMENGNSSEVVYTYKEFDGMKYLFATGYQGGTISINLTKDSLEVEVLRKQLIK